MTPKQRFFATIQGQPHDRAPVTPIVMQWAAHLIGRSYRDYCLDGAVLAQGQIAAARTLHTDWVSVMSDPWCESSAYGMVFDYPESSVGVPREYVIQTTDDARHLPPLDLESKRPQDRLRCIEIEHREVGDTHPVCGWVEGPIAQYADLRGLQAAMMDLVDEPDAFHAAAEHLVAEAARFARAQVEAGADAIGIGDAAASIIGPALYRTHVLPFEIKLIKAIHAAGAAVKLHICGDLRAILTDVVRTDADIIDLDWMVPITMARQLAPTQCFAGNFDPCAVLLRGTAAEVADAARRCLAEGGDRFMLQPGCEVPADTPMDNLRAFCPTAAD